MYKIFRVKVYPFPVRLKAFIKRAFKERKVVFGGFTFIELVVVIAIVGTLTGIGIPAYSIYIDKAKMIKTITEIRILEKEIIIYHEAKDSLPETLDNIDRADLKDPWGNPYQYLNIETATGQGKMRKDRFLVPINSDFDLYSMGKDCKSHPPLTAKASHDDIIRANNGEFIGLASEY